MSWSLVSSLWESEAGTRHLLPGVRSYIVVAWWISRSRENLLSYGSFKCRAHVEGGGHQSRSPAGPGGL